MLSFDDMKNIYSNVGTVGQQLKVMSDEVMQETFDNDLQTKLCYIYDYYHDDQTDMEYGYNPALSKTKIPVKLKFIVKTYKSMAKDDPEYHIMFEPDVWNSMSCKPDWFVREYERLGIRFPIGLMVDVPDDRGVYNKWIICYDEDANQFPKFGIRKCNYLFQWIEDDGVYRYKRKMWGVNSVQSSYTSGVWRGDKLQVFDEQDKFYLPYNQITAGLKHDIRLCISMLQPEPYVFTITKVNNTSPKGIIIFTVKQDRFEKEHDYVCLDSNSENYGEMYADYFSSSVIPDEKIEIQNSNDSKIVIEAANYNVKLGTSKVLTAKIYDAENNDITNEYLDSECIWDIELIHIENVQDELIVVDEKYSLKDGNKFKYKFKFNGDEQYLGKNIKVICKIDNISAEASLDIIAL